MKNVENGRFLLILFLTSFLCCNANEESQSKYPELSKLSVGVFGGSVSSVETSEAAKTMWIKEFGFKVSTHGVGGAGFSNITSSQNIPQQISNAPVYDVYILWASTNDAVKGASVGNLDTEDLSTQNGGILKCISLIKEKNENAQILFFISMYRFDKYHDVLTPFIEAQKNLCKQLDIPYLDQSTFYNEDNYQNYYLEDKIHLTRSGYTKIAPYQIEFLIKNLNIQKCK